VRARLSKFWFEDRIESVTPAELAAAHSHGEHDSVAGADEHRSIEDGSLTTAGSAAASSADGTGASTPAATGGVPGAAWDYRVRRPDVGGNVRWGVTNNLTLNGTVNPDFSQVEADAAQVQFDPRQALFFPERRPFFLDGIEQFSVPNGIIYTRRIVQPSAAAKLTGKIAGTDVAVLSAVDDPGLGRDQPGRHPLFNIVRVQRDVGAQSRIGAVLTDVEAGDAGYNRVAGLDARMVFRKVYSAQAQLVGSTTRSGADGETRTGPLWQAFLLRNGRRFGFRYSAYGVDPDFMPGAGFISRQAIGQPSIGVGTSSFGTLVGGSTSAYFTDLLGNRNLAVGVQANGTVRDIGGQVQYFNLERRWLWGVSAGRIPFLTGFTQLAPTDNPNVALYQQVLQRVYIDQISGTLQYPLSVTRRFEVNPGFNRYSYNSEVQEVPITRNGQVVGATTRRSASEFNFDPVNVGQVGIAFVGDNSFGGFVSPLAGPAGLGLSPEPLCLFRCSPRWPSSASPLHASAVSCLSQPSPALLSFTSWLRSHGSPLADATQVPFWAPLITLP